MDIANGKRLPDGTFRPYSQAEIRARSNLYMNASNKQYWRGKTEAKIGAGFIFERRFTHNDTPCDPCTKEAAKGKQPIGTLPKPGEDCDGTTNCRCTMEYYKADGSVREDIENKIPSTPTARQAKKSTGDYLDKNLDNIDLQVLKQNDFDKKFGSPDDSIHGGIAAIRTPDGKVYIKEGFEQDMIHELVHSSGALEDGVGEFLNEGITQSIAERIGVDGGYAVRETYGKETRFVKRYIEPLVGNKKRFYRGYVNAENKGKYTVDEIWKRHGDKFNDVDDWGKDPKARLYKNLPQTLGTDTHLSYLVDELGVGQ